MDNKQKKKLFKLVYYTSHLLLLITIAFSVYVCANQLYSNQSLYLWLDISLIIIQTVFAFLMLYDSHKTKKQQNKFVLSIFVFLMVLISIVGFGCVWALSYFNQIVLIQTNILSLSLLVINTIAFIFVFGLGLKLSKLFRNTTLTINSTTETPNYDDELMLKKKLDELNRKLEIKKVQEQINSIEQELDNNNK